MSTTKKSSLKTYTSDLLALEKHFMNAIKKQKSSGRVKDERAIELLHELDKSISGNVKELEAQAMRLGGDLKTSVKSRIASFTGSVAGMIDSVRDDTVSKMLRDNYAALSMVTIGYTMLHTHALSEEDTLLSEMSHSHLEKCTILITEISKVVPLITAHEINSDAARAEEIGKKALENTQAAWKPEHVNQEPQIV